MKFAVLFFIIGLTMASGFVIKHEITFNSMDVDAESDSVEAFPDQGNMAYMEVEPNQVDNPNLTGCNPKECKRICWEQFHLAGSCHGPKCSCR